MLGYLLSICKRRQNRRWNFSRCMTNCAIVWWGHFGPAKYLVQDHVVPGCGIGCRKGVRILQLPLLLNPPPS